MSLTVAAFYRFTRLCDPQGLVAPVRTAAAGLTGTVLLAPEGINGTVAGTPERIAAFIAFLRNLPGCAELDWKRSDAPHQPFRRLKVRLKREIVTMGVADADPTARVGTYVAPRNWNAVIDDPDTVVIDTRNAYETGIGSFTGAVDPETDSFRAFPDWWRRNAARFDGKRIAMFCTGGIRCEKASSWLLAQGVPEVLHLKGGILKYLEDVPATESRWQGECFVFDERVALGHGLEQGDHGLCHACGRPVSPEDQSHPAYAEGISCPACIDEYSDTDRARFAERQRQIALAKARGERHLVPATIGEAEESRPRRSTGTVQ